jgi:outer membrane protein OmpA-like peptidoglycan-associated protein
MRNRYVTLFLLGLISLVNVQAQTKVVVPKSDYSRWSIGANVGMPFFWGDFKSFSADKTYYGINGGLQLTYQISALLGITLTGDYGQNKAGSRDYSKGYLLDQNGFTYYVPQTKTTAAYGTLYSKISYFSAGLGVDINLNRLFSSRIGNRRFTFLLTPTAWLQKFSTDVYKKSDDSKYTDGSPKQNLHTALGGSFSIRYRASRSIDLQLKNTFAYIYNDKFDGIDTHPYTRQNYMWVPQLGIVFKLGNTKSSGKIDNLLYYGSNVTKEVPAPVKEEPVVQEQPKQEPVKEEPKPQPVKVEIPTLPNLYFAFNSSELPTETQADDLNTIVEAAKKYADYPIVLKGYADRVGTDAYNNRLSQARADAVKAYLVKQGISETRISTEGCGKDTTVEDKDARRVEVKLMEN